MFDIKTGHEIGHKVETSSASVDSLTVRGHKIGTKIFANLLVGAPMTDETGRNLGQLLITGIWTFVFSYKIPDLESLG